MDKKLLAQWYLDNGIDNIVENSTFNHFEEFKKNIELKNKKKIEEDVNRNKILEEENNSMQYADYIHPDEPESINSKSPIDEFISIAQIEEGSKTSITIENKIKIETESESGEKIKVETKEVKKITSSGNNREEFNFNYIYQNLANKYKNDNMKMTKNEIITTETAISKARELADNSNTIEELRDAVENFDGYLDIKNLATNTVFGDGDVNAEIMIIGEAPGNNEDIEGIPFCGQSGQLLGNMFKSIGFERKDLYITNTLFWRPPGNRTPTEDEVSICRPFVEKHIALINPKIIVFMGATALKDLIETNLTITKARRNIFDYTNKYLEGKTIKSTPLFHPSYLLRQSSKKKDAWGDLLFIQDVLSGN